MGKRAAGKKNKRGKRGGKRKASSIESAEGSNDEMETIDIDSSTDAAGEKQSTTDTLQQTTQQATQQQQKQTSNFLPEPFPKAPTSSTQHLHDAYGDDLNDEGVDYGPPNEFEEDDDEEEVGEGLEQSDNSVDAMDMNVDIKECGSDIKQQDDIKATSLQEDISNNTSQPQQLEQLEETLELHTTTLQTLHTKLQSLSTSISTEHTYNSELTTDIQLLQKRKVIFKKKTDKNITLVKELECNLDKCLGRLRQALDELNDNGGEEGGGEVGLDGGGVGLDELAEEKVLEAAARLDEVADDNSSLPSFTEDVDNEPAKDGKLAHQPIRSAVPTQYNIKIIPLKSNPNQQTSNISWPSTKLVTKRYNEIKSLSTNIGIPTTHFTILSSGGSSILGGLNNIQLIVNVMNVAALENLLQRDKYESELTRRRNEQNGCGWVKESDIWGTSLDVYTHVNWKTLFAGFTRRMEEESEQQQRSGVEGLTSSKRDRNECNVVDPNTILCPYELGGECADGQCPYQHLKQRGDGNVQGYSSNSNGVREGYVRYNNLSKTKLPRSFVKDDFVISCTAVRDDDTDVADMSNNKEEELQIEDNRRFHCPICVVDNNDKSSSSSPYNSQEELQKHMAECHKQSSSQTANGKSVTIRHTSLTAEDAAIRNQEILKHYTAKNEQHDSSSDDDSTSGADGDEHLEHKSTEGDDASMTFHQNDNGSAPTAAEDNGQLHAGVEDNLDYVSLPSVADSVESTSHQGGRIGSSHKSSKKRTTLFNNTFWWQQVDSFSISEDVIEECQDNFHCLLLSFGFQYLTNEEGPGHSLGCIMPTPSDKPIPAQEQVNDILLFSRLIDLSRVLVHMGRLSFALAVMSSIEIRIDRHPLICRPYWRAYHTVKSLVQSQHSAYTFFQVQVQLLVLSDYLHTNYDSLVGNNNDAPCLNQSLVDKMLNLHDVGKYSENNLFPEGFDRLRQNLVSHLPSANNDKSNGGDDWASFTTTLKHIIEKFIIVPFSQIGTDDQFLFLLRSVCIGKYLGNNIVRNASKERGFVSYIHALEPIWSSLQPLLQVSLTSAFTRWLQPDVVAIVLIGPIIFSCVADMVSDRSGTTQNEETSSKFDARARANLSTLDNFIVGIIKDLNRFGRSRRSSQLEPLLTPLYALSTAMSVALGSFDKAHVRLEHVLNKEVEEQPSLYALSDLMWSQLVQLRVLCPSYSTPLDTSDVVPKPLPDQITKSHHELAHRIVENGVFLWGVKLPGDSHMNIISPCFNKNHCTEWEKVATQIFTHHESSDSEQPSLEFSISDPYPEKLEGIRECRELVFPDSLLLLEKSLTSLTLDKCGLTRLPLSIGYHLTNLKVSCFVPYHSLFNLFVLLALSWSQHNGNTQNKSLNLANNLLTELPDSICCMEQLEVINISYNKLKIFPKQLSQCSKLRVIDVSYNQLDTFPADLAIVCNNLESFIVDGNPAAVSSPPSAKRQRVGRDWGELF